MICMRIHLSNLSLNDIFFSLLTANGSLLTWGWTLNAEAVVHLGAQFDRYPSYVQGLQQSAWASYLPDLLTFRRADTVPLQPPEIAGVRFRAVAVGGSFYLAVDGMRACLLIACIFS
jgi:hypothetical protein